MVPESSSAPWWLALTTMLLVIVTMALLSQPAAAQRSPAAQPTGAKKKAKPVELPPLLSGQDAYRLLTSDRADSITWLYSGDSSLKPPLDRAKVINWQAFVHTGKDGVAWRLNDLAKVKAQLRQDYELSQDRPVVIFGDSITKFLLVSSGWGEEGRIAWMLEVAGYSKVSLVDGGYKAILAKAPSQTLAGQFNLGPASQGPASQGGAKSVNFTELRQRQQKDPASLVILDTRSWDEYRGLTSYIGVKGRIPAARHFHVDDFFDDSGKILPVAELSARLRKKGIDGKTPIVTYCSGGVRSAMAYYILRYHLGFPEVANYDGSWAEWAIKGPKP